MDSLRLSSCARGVVLSPVYTSRSVLFPRVDGGVWCECCVNSCQLGGSPLCLDRLAQTAAQKYNFPLVSSVNTITLSHCTSQLHIALAHRIFTLHCRVSLVLVSLLSLLSCVWACPSQAVDWQKHKEALEQKMSIMARFVAGHLGSTFRAVQSCLLFCWLTFIAGTIATCCAT